MNQKTNQIQRKNKDRFREALEALNRDYAKRVNELAAVFFTSKGVVKTS